MNAEFANIVDDLHPAFERLVAMAPYRYDQPRQLIPVCGVYVFSEGERFLYVGRSNNLTKRYGQHCNPGATHNTAAFAFLLARETTGFLKASYLPDANSRKSLMENPAFRQAFDEAKVRIRAMEFRFVEEDDQIRQALLEIYCAMALKAPYNDFRTH